MASVQEIRKKIQAVKNTQKITKAMQLVATAKMRNFQKKAASAKAFVGNICAILNIYKWSNHQHELLLPREKGKILFLMYSSDKGLCGKLNSTLAKALLNSPFWKNLPPEQKLLLTVGKKARDFAAANNIAVCKSYVNLNENLNSWEVLELIDFIFQLWEKKEIKEVVFLSPNFKNTLTYYANFQTFLPLSENTVDYYLPAATKKFAKDDIHLFNEPSKEGVMDGLLATIVKGIMFSVFYELKAAEYSSRMIAMQSATDSAQKQIQELTLVYNKTRQQYITQQLIELMGAAESI